jgi:hypothetical protein
MRTPLPHLAFLVLFGVTSLHAQIPFVPVTRTYQVQQNVTLSEIPSGAKNVKWWISIPDADRYQDVLDFSVVSAPGPWRIVTEPKHGNRFMLVEVATPAAQALVTKIEFKLRRRAFFTDIIPSKAGLITETHRQIFADELRKDEPHMQVTPEIAKMADEACGRETNIAIQARRLLDKVADYAAHYSKDPTKQKISLGDAEKCLANAGGTCTDIHSLFIALARSRGIPARLQMGYRLRTANEGKEVDPGYRCWAEYFVPGYGWLSADVVEADDPKGLGRTRWFSGLTSRRVWLNEGREFDLPGRAVTSHRVNLMTTGYAEIDGVEARVLPDGDRSSQLTRTIYYTEIKADAVEGK